MASLQPPASRVPEPGSLPRASGRVLHLLLLTTLALFAFGYRAGSADLRDDADAVQPQLIIHVAGGDGFILPRRNGVQLPEKPMLYPWLGALSATLRGSGVDLLDVRLPALLAAVATVIATYVFADAIAGSQVALWAGLVLITTPQFAIGARDPRVDMVFAACTVAAIMLGWRVCTGNAGRRAALVAALCTGLAVLAKGPLGLALVSLVLSLGVIILRPARGWRAFLTPAVPALAAGLPAAWYLGATVVGGREFLDLHLLEENVRRLTGGLDRSPPWYYVEPLVTLGVPWTLLLPWVVAGGWQPERQANDPTVQQRTSPSADLRFVWIWFLGMLALFTLSVGKRRAYLLPLRPALAILVAAWLVPAFARGRASVPARALPVAADAVVGGLTAVVLAGVLALWLGAGGWGMHHQSGYTYWWRVHLQDHLLPAMVLVVGSGVAIDLMIRWWLAGCHERAAFALVGLAALVLGIGFSADQLMRGEAVSFRPFAVQVNAVVPAGTTLSFLDVNQQFTNSFLFHVRRPVAVRHAVEVAAPCSAPAPGYYLLSEKRWDAARCADDPRWRELLRGGPEKERQRFRRLVLARYTG